MINHLRSLSNRSISLLYVASSRWSRTLSASTVPSLTTGSHLSMAALYTQGRERKTDMNNNLNYILKQRYYVILAAASVTISVIWMAWDCEIFLNALTSWRISLAFFWRFLSWVTASGPNLRSGKRNPFHSIPCLIKIKKYIEISSISYILPCR